MKLSTWAKKQGISYRTAWRWFKEGNLPVVAEQTPTGTILIREAPSTAEQVAIYARVSSSDQKGDLEKQVTQLAIFVNTQKWVLSETVIEIGSALNGHRPMLKKLLSNSNIKIIVVEHLDRLMRFGAEYVVVDAEEVKDDLVQDMIEVLTSFCARLYGRRSAKNRAKKAVEAIQNES
jgi:putative resolvase